MHPSLPPLSTSLALCFETLASNKFIPILNFACKIFPPVQTGSPSQSLIYSLEQVWLLMIRHKTTIKYFSTFNPKQSKVDRIYQSRWSSSSNWPASLPSANINLMLVFRYAIYFFTLINPYCWTQRFSPSFEFDVVFFVIMKSVWTAHKGASSWNMFWFVMCCVVFCCDFVATEWNKYSTRTSFDTFEPFIQIFVGWVVSFDWRYMGNWFEWAPLCFDMY